MTEESLGAGMPVFGAASVQGSPEDEIAPEFVLDVGMSLGMQYKKVAVGRDMQSSSPMVQECLMSGLTAAGADVFDAGVLPSPALPFAAKGCDCCVMISSPDSRNSVSGLWFSNVDGMAFTDAQMLSLRNRLDREKTLPSYKLVGSVRRVTGAVDRYRSKVAAKVGAADCLVAIDCASECSSVVAPHIITDIGADAVSLNSHGDGRSAFRQPSIGESDLRMLSKVVKANYGSVGVALNGDGSRMAALDEDGRYIDGDTLLALFVKYLEPKSISLPVDTSMAVRDVMEGSVIMTKLGARHVSDSVKSDGTEMGGSSDGSFIFPDISYAPDGITAAALLAKIATEFSLRDMIDDMPTYYRERMSIPFPPEHRDAVARQIGAKMNDTEHRSLYELDGWRAELDGGWFLVRFSDAADEVDVTVEAKDKAYAVSLMEVAGSLVSGCVKQVGRRAPGPAAPRGSRRPSSCPCRTGGR